MRFTSFITSMTAFVVTTPSSSSQVASQNSRAYYLSAQPDGLHKAAVADGGSYTASGPNEPKGKASSLEDLVASSDIIFVGIAVNQKAELVSEGRAIDTIYSFESPKYLKGKVGLPKTIEYRVPGGTYKFGDGSIAYYKVKSRKYLIVGHRYLVFAREIAGHSGRLTGAAWDESAIEIDLHHRAFDQAVASSSVVHVAAKDGEQALIKRIEEIVAAQAK